MAKKVVGKVSREMNKEHLNTRGSKARGGASLRGMRTISPAQQGRYWRDDEDI